MCLLNEQMSDDADDVSSTGSQCLQVQKLRESKRGMSDGFSISVKFWTTLSFWTLAVCCSISEQTKSARAFCRESCHALHSTSQCTVTPTEMARGGSPSCRIHRQSASSPSWHRSCPGGTI